MLFSKAIVCILFIRGGELAAIPIDAHYDFDEFYYAPEVIEAFLIPANVPVQSSGKPNEIKESRQFGVYRPIYFRPFGRWPSRHNPALNPLYGLRNPYSENKGSSSSPQSLESYASVYGATSIYDIGGFYG